MTFPGRMYAFVNFREAADAAQAAQAVQVWLPKATAVCIVWCCLLLTVPIHQQRAHATTTAAVVCKSSHLTTTLPAK